MNGFTISDKLASNILKIEYVGKKIYNENEKQVLYMTIKNNDIINLIEIVKSLKSHGDMFDLYINNLELITEIKTYDLNSYL